MCKCAVEKQDKAVQVPEDGFQDGGPEGTADAVPGQYVGFDDAGGILYDVSTHIMVYNGHLQIGLVVACH